MEKKTLTCGAAIATITMLMAGCTPVQKYHPVPLSPAESASSLEGRTLDDPGLRSFIEQSLGHSMPWPTATWDLQMLTLTAFYFNPRLAVARAQLETAQAGIATAEMRPNPVLEVSPGVPSPYLLGLSIAFPIVTGGRRKYQVELAKTLSQVAAFNLAEAVWSVRGGVRTALVNYIVADHALAVTRSEGQLWLTRVSRLSEQVSAGEIPKPELDTARIALLNSRLAAQTAQGRVVEAKAALAAAIGIPLSGIGNAHFTWPDFEQIPSVTSLSPRRIEKDAVLNRLNVRRALAQYSAAQSALQLEIARQHPNFQLGPGYEYEERNSFFAPLFSIPLPVFNRNQGPIAEAEARRREAAASLLATQASVMAQSEQALTGYRAAFAELKTAQAALENLRGVRVPMTRQAVAVGEMDWLSLNSVLLERSAAANVALNSLFQAQTALGRLEDAVQRPLEASDTTPMVLAVPKRR